MKGSPFFICDEVRLREKFPTKPGKSTGVKSPKLKFDIWRLDPVSTLSLGISN
jgi:hypothetical protein